MKEGSEGGVQRERHRGAPRPEGGRAAAAEAVGKQAERREMVSRWRLSGARPRGEPRRV